MILTTYFTENGKATATPQIITLGSTTSELKDHLDWMEKQDNKLPDTAILFV